MLLFLGEINCFLGDWLQTWPRPIRSWKPQNVPGGSWTVFQSTRVPGKAQYCASPPVVIASVVAMN